jgi:hexosaminidase
VAHGTTSSFDLQQFGRELNYGVVFEGYLKAPKDGFFQFEMDSDDGSALRIDDEEVINNDGIHGGQVLSGHIPLRQGFHKIQLKYFQAGGGSGLRVSWAESGEALKSIDGALLFH